MAESTWASGNAFDGDWSAPENWTPAPPGVGDTAFIEAGTVTYSAASTLIGQLYDYGAFDLTGGTLTVAGTAYIAPSPFAGYPTTPKMVQTGGVATFGPGSVIVGFS